MINITWQRETDVVVVGGGLAGYCAASEAAAQGAHVLLLEKQPEIGGSTALSSGFFAFAGTAEQRQQGIEDSNALLLHDLKSAGGNENDERLLQVYAEHQLDAYAWLKRAGVGFSGVELASAQSVPRAHAVDVQVLIKSIVDLAHGTGRVETLPNMRVERLLRPEPDGDVAGVSVQVNGTPQAIRARRGIVLASGGFSRSAEMLRSFVPAQAAAVHYGGAGNTGDGIRMAWQLGAGFRDFGHIKGTFGFHTNARTQAGRGWTKLFIYRGAIAVNRLGRRYVDESSSYKLLGDAVLRQPDAMAFQVFDQRIMDTASDGVSPFDFRSAQKRGLVDAADSIEALAKKIGVDPAALATTIRRYNDFVANGCDEDYGRDGLSNHYGRLVPIDRAPFYAYATTSGLLATYCGLTVETDTRVLDVFGTPIRGLFAAGEIMGGFHGVSYMTGSALGKCVIFGRIAGRNAAASSKQ